MAAHPDPFNRPLAPSGKAAVLAPLIIGGAVIVSLILIWDAHARKSRLSEMADNEIAARAELRSAWLEMRHSRPGAALEKTANAAALIAKMKPVLSGGPRTDYAELRISLLLLEGEALFMEDSAANAVRAEGKFDEALALMVFSSGPLWHSGHLGRGRARLEQGRYAEAIADFDQVAARNPGYGAAYYWRAIAREKSGDGSGARRDESVARRLDSWPPLRAFMPASGEEARDILWRTGPKIH